MKHTLQEGLEFSFYFAFEWIWMTVDKHLYDPISLSLKGIPIHGIPCTYLYFFTDLQPIFF